MADFTFNDGNAPSDTGNQSGDKSGGTGGAAGIENGNSGVEGANFRIEPESNPAPKKRRGRKPYPRDSAGNPIRPAATDSGTGAGSNKSGKEGLAVKNDKDAVKQNILGLHAMAAVLTRQPILALQEKEGEILSNSLCDVADYHNINLLQAGGAFGLYASLCTACYMIYVPRFAAIKQNRAGIENTEQPINPGDAREGATARAGTMNFEGDIKYN